MAAVQERERESMPPIIALLPTFLMILTAGAKGLKFGTAKGRTTVKEVLCHKVFISVIPHSLECWTIKWSYQL